MIGEEDMVGEEGEEEEEKNLDNEKKEESEVLDEGKESEEEEESEYDFDDIIISCIVCFPDIKAGFVLREDITESFTSNVASACSIAFGTLQTDVKIISSGSDAAYVKIILNFYADPDNETATKYCLNCLRKTNISETCFSMRYNFNVGKWGSSKVVRVNGEEISGFSQFHSLREIAISNAQTEDERIRMLALKKLRETMPSGTIVRVVGKDKIQKLEFQRWVDIFGDEAAEEHREEYQLWEGAYAMIQSHDEEDDSCELKNFSLYNDSLPEISSGAHWPLSLLRPVTKEEEAQLLHQLHVKEIQRKHLEEYGVPGMSPTHSVKDEQAANESTVVAVSKKEEVGSLLKNGMIVKTASRPVIAALEQERWEEIFGEDAKRIRREYVLWADATCTVESVDTEDWSVELKNFRKFNSDLPDISSGAFWPTELITIKNAEDLVADVKIVEEGSITKESEGDTTKDSLREGMLVKIASKEAIEATSKDVWEELFQEHHETHAKEYPEWAGLNAEIAEVDDSDNSVCLKNLNSLNEHVPLLESGGAWWPKHLIISMENVEESVQASVN
eukprot:g578.t1